jgi:molecular chaperone GrpE
MDKDNRKEKPEAEEKEEVKEEAKEEKPEEKGAKTPDPPSPELQIARLKEENEYLKDARLRILAEFDNFKKRTLREQLSIIANANEDIIRELLPVLENLERAIHPDHKTPETEAIYNGVEMICNQFNECLKKAGLKEINPAGEEFNPNLHEAVMHVESADVPENKIAQVLQKGYFLNEKVIQYAKVAVSKGNTK